MLKYRFDRKKFIHTYGHILYVRYATVRWKYNLEMESTDILFVRHGNVRMVLYPIEQIDIGRLEEIKLKIIMYCNVSTYGTTFVEDMEVAVNDAFTIILEFLNNFQFYNYL